MTVDFLLRLAVILWNHLHKNVISRLLTAISTFVYSEHPTYLSLERRYALSKICSRSDFHASNNFNATALLAATARVEACLHPLRSPQQSSMRTCRSGSDGRTEPDLLVNKDAMASSRSFYVCFYKILLRVPRGLYLIVNALSRCRPPVMERRAKAFRLSKDDAAVEDNNSDVHIF